MNVMSQSNTTSRLKIWATESSERYKNIKLRPSVIEEILKHLGKEGKGLTECTRFVSSNTSTKCWKWFKGKVSREVVLSRHPCIPVRDVPMLWLYINFLFIPNVHLCLVRGFFPPVWQIFQFRNGSKKKMEFSSQKSIFAANFLEMHLSLKAICFIRA